MYSQKSLKKKAGKVRLLGDMKTEAAVEMQGRRHRPRNEDGL